MKIYALCNAQGTATPETALCQEHSDARNRRMARERASSDTDVDSPFVDCTENDQLSCLVCGRVSSTLVVGEKLDNDCTLVAHTRLSPDESVVLALTNGQSGHKYATWFYENRNGITVHGHYHNSIVEAVADFAQRGGK